MKLLIWDYGIGGIGLYKLLKNQQKFDITYFSDAGCTPYGILSSLTLKERVEQVIEYFNKKGIEKIAVACNAASTAIPSHHNIKGLIEFGISSVMALDPKEVAVVGGGRTIKSKIYKNYFEKNGIETTQEIAQELSILIEAGKNDGVEIKRAIQSIFEPIRNHSHILLACSHYPAIIDQIQEYTKNAIIVDPIYSMSEWIIGNWHTDEVLTEINWLTTGDKNQMKISAMKSFGVEIDKIKQISI